MNKTEATVTMSREDWDRLESVWEALQSILCSMPFTVEDCMDSEEARIDYHKVLDFMDGTPYDPSLWGDGEDGDDLDVDDEEENDDE